MSNYFMTIIGVLSIFLGGLNAQVKIGDNHDTINPNAILELESTDRGLLLPRVALVGTTNTAPLDEHKQGMLVFNTASSGTGDTAVSPGMYYNNGTKWELLRNSTSNKNEQSVTVNLTTTYQTISGIEPNSIYHIKFTYDDGDVLTFTLTGGHQEGVGYYASLSSSNWPTSTASISINGDHETIEVRWNDSTGDFEIRTTTGSENNLNIDFQKTF